MATSDVKLDFHGDFRQIVERTLTNNAIALDPAEPYNDAVYRYHANACRRLNVQRYAVIGAMDLACPEQLTPGYAELKSELEQGVDITARLSRKTQNATYEDQLLNGWGIIHFHLGLRDAQGKVPRTGVILFAFVRGDVVHCIGFFDHESWSRIEVLEILQRNWPEAIGDARVKRVTGYDVTDEEHARLRASGALILNMVNGSVFASIGGGYTAAGTSGEAHKQADRAILSVDVYEKHVRENIGEILKDFGAAGRHVGTPPAFHLDFLEDGRAIATERNAQASFILGPFPL